MTGGKISNVRPLVHALFWGPRMHGSTGVAAVSGKIYVINGWDGECSLNTAARMAPSGPSGAARRWQPLAEMSAPLECPGVGTLNNRLYAVGGTWGDV